MYQIDSLVSTLLVVESVPYLDVLNWFREVQLDDARVIFMAYHEK